MTPLWCAQRAPGLEESAASPERAWTGARGGAMMSGMVELPVPPRLARFVRRIRAVSGPQATDTYRRLPDGETELVVGFGGGGGSATAIGTRTRALRKHAPARAGHLLVRFHIAGAYPFFGRPMSEITDQVVSLEALWHRGACAALASASDASTAAGAVLAALTRVLAGEAIYEPGSAVGARRAVRAILAAPRLPSVGELAGGLGASERQLRRAFDQVIGMSPKRFVRVVRLQRALAAARATPRADWATIAERAGYFDQAHLIADFRAMTGETPGALVARQRAAGSRAR
ncbi:helix-turn-helix domain-containing protein [Sorangium sp. So ce1128]